MTWIELVIRGFAVFFVAVATAKFVEDICRFPRQPLNQLLHDTIEAEDLWRQSIHGRLAWVFNRKPFNCSFCLCFWWAISLSPFPLNPIYILAIAGIASVLVALRNRIELVDFS